MMMSMRWPAVNAWLLKPAAKPVLWTLYALPALALLGAALSDRLGANPAEKLIRETGEWALRWLWLTLAVTPLRELMGWPGLVRHRRALGVTAFLYALLHLLLPLALTSTNAAIRALGGRRWRWLHRLVYAIALLGLLHFYWMKASKNHVDEVVVYAAVLAVLLGWRAMRAGGPLKWLAPR